jgi:putative ABC transport system substrate-binding protein
MNRKTGHVDAGLRRRVRADDVAGSQAYFHRSTRRRLLLALGASALGAPFGSFAQQPGKVWRVGFLSPRARPDSLDSDIFGAFRLGMRELGYVEGKNLAIEWRFAGNNLGRLDELAAELAQLKVDIIVTGGPGALAAQKASTTIPIVFFSVTDPVGIGVIKSLARPGGNITGLSNNANEIGAKRLELLLAMMPSLSRLAFLSGSTASAMKSWDIVRAAAQKRRVTILLVKAGTPEEIETAFAAMVRQKAGALIVPLNPLFQQQSGRIAALSAKYRLPCMAADRSYAEAGCLMSYGSSLTDEFRRGATYVDKIFKGAKPSDLPVEEPTKYELIINAKTAKALGLKIPQSLLVSADEVIQ